MVMARDGDCAPRSATRIVSFHRFGMVAQLGLTGQSPLPKSEAYLMRDSTLVHHFPDWYCSEGVARPPIISDWRPAMF
jgi:hypothetical protein